MMKSSLLFVLALVFKTQVLWAEPLMNTCRPPAVDDNYDFNGPRSNSVRQSTTRELSNLSRIPTDPWPFGSEIAFPWRSIQGLWQGWQNNCESYFVFKVVSRTNGDKILQVIQYDPYYCVIISKGTGFERDKSVTAVMTGKKGTFELTISAFKEKDLKVRRDRDPSATVMVMSMAPVGQPKNRANLELLRLTPEPVLICE